MWADISSFRHSGRVFKNTLKKKSLEFVVAAVFICCMIKGDNGGDRVDRIDGDMGDSSDNQTGDTCFLEVCYYKNIPREIGFVSNTFAYKLLVLNTKATIMRLWFGRPYSHIVYWPH